MFSRPWLEGGSVNSFFDIAYLAGTLTFQVLDIAALA